MDRTHTFTLEVACGRCQGAVDLVPSCHRVGPVGTYELQDVLPQSRYGRVATKIGGDTSGPCRRGDAATHHCC